MGAPKAHCVPLGPSLSSGATAAPTVAFHPGRFKHHRQLAKALNSGALPRGIQLSALKPLREALLQQSLQEILIRSQSGFYRSSAKIMCESFWSGRGKCISKQPGHPLFQAFL